MKKIYLKPEIEEVTISSMQLLVPASTRMDFKRKYGLDDEYVDDEIDDFDQLL